MRECALRSRFKAELRSLGWINRLYGELSKSGCKISLYSYNIEVYDKPVKKSSGTTYTWRKGSLKDIKGELSDLAIELAKELKIK